MATNENLIPIPGRLHSVATEGHVAGADQIIDDETGLTLDKVTGGALEEKTYTSGSDNGMGRIVLRKNLVNGVNTLTQSMINKSNTIYIVQYDFTLGEDITVPENCVLEFDGGSISGSHTLTGNNTGIQAGLIKIFGTDVIFAGTWNVVEAYPEWYGAKADGVTDNYLAIDKILFFDTIRFLEGHYKVVAPNNSTVLFNCRATGSSNLFDPSIEEDNTNKIIAGVRGKTFIEVHNVNDNTIVFFLGLRRGTMKDLLIKNVEVSDYSSAKGIAVLYGDTNTAYYRHGADIENMYLIGFSFGIKVTATTCRLSQCSATKCDTGFYFGIINGQNTRNTTVNGKLLLSDSCNIGIEMHSLDTSMIETCGCDNCNIAFKMTYCQNTKMLNCGGEYNRRAFYSNNNWFCSIEDFYTIIDDSKFNSDYPKARYIMLEGSGETELKNIHFNVADDSLIYISGGNPSYNHSYCFSGSIPLNLINTITATTTALAQNCISYNLNARINSTPRPTLPSIAKGLSVYDITISKPIWWNGSAWVDATGTPV